MIETAIVGAGPYGLSIAAHFRGNGIPFRIFGRPMDSWLAHMPKGMMLKSDGFASNIYDPDSQFTLKDFCTERGIKYADMGIPVGLQTFSDYGLAFRDRMVPELEDKFVVNVERADDGFRLRLDDGEEVKARRVILAVGITHFAHIPKDLAHLPSDLVSHSYNHHDLTPFKGRDVVVLGAGSSAIDTAGLLRDADANVQLVARATSLRFHTGPKAGKRSLWQRLRHPDSGLGPGLRTRFFSDGAALFHHLPAHQRVEMVRTTLGPSAGWFMKDKVMGRVPLVLGHSVERASARGGKVCLSLRGLDGSTREILTEHVIAGTGYKVDIDRLTFLDQKIRASLKRLSGMPVLSSMFESSVPGLYFVGVSAANSFGPVMRFAFGAGFTAKRLTRTMRKVMARGPASVPASSMSTIVG
ncbi:MAG TPA: NAD(P)-binding domain-containing protein [Candidatus Limnocylindrales bacterium]|nr:NAD(P)-binding domain-containing protein [Candidatus Limnocylindrales bacterium]